MVPAVLVAALGAVVLLTLLGGDVRTLTMSSLS